MDSVEGLNISGVLVAGTLGLVTLVFAIILFMVVYQRRLMRQQTAMQEKEALHQKEMLEATIFTQEKERTRIAQDLHDDIGATLSTIKLGVNQIQRNLPKDTDVTEVATETKKMIDEAILNVRRISKELLPATLKEFGLVSAFEELCRKTDATTEIAVTFYNAGKSKRYDYSIELALFRAAQEALNNAMKHAEAEKIEISLDTTKLGEIALTISDNGKGFDMKALEARAPGDRGLGLRNIESRVSIVNSHVEFNSAPGKGTRILIKLFVN